MKIIFLERVGPFSKIGTVHRLDATFRRLLLNHGLKRLFSAGKEAYFYKKNENEYR
jgi:hypothetical protein